MYLLRSEPDPEIRGQQYFIDIFQLLIGENKALRVMILHCFQLSTRRCMFCERFSSYQAKMIGVLETLNIQLNIELLDHFLYLMQALPVAKNFKGFKKMIMTRTKSNRR